MSENKPYIEAMRELRKGSRTSPHNDSRNKRARTRRAAIERAREDYR